MGTCGEAREAADRDLDASFARSMEASVDVAAYLPELVADLWDMGCVPEAILAVLRPLELPAATRALDLGCGKGAVGITLAAELGFACVGIDLCEPFLEAARAKAEELGVADRCEFRRGDIREAVLRERGHDVVVYASLGDAIGGYREQIRLLRETVREGGYVVIDDGFLRSLERLDRPGYEYCRGREVVVSELTSCGDRLAAEVVVPDERTREINLGYLRAIRERADSIAAREPRAAASIDEYVRRQEEECRVIDEHLASAVWLVQRFG
jgi:cyclopropane fatty-acyl-phospholipid synthase-like methyltransferase